MKKSNSKFLSNSIAIILTLTIFLISWKFILPSYSSNRAKSTALTSEVSEAQEKIASIDSAKADLSGISDTINQLLVAIPSDKDIPNLISELEAIAAKNSLIIPAIDTSGQTAAAATETSLEISSGTPVNISFSVAGPVDNIFAFTGSLEKSIKFMNIKAITMTSENGTDVSASYNIEAYSRGNANDGEAL